MLLASISSTSQAADLDRIVYEPGYAATVSIAGAFGELDVDEFNDGYDLSSLIGSGDFVLPLHSNWNIQLSGAGRYDWLDFDFGGNGSNTQALFNTVGFYRDPMTGLIGFDVGFYSLGYYPFANAPRWSFLRAGAVAEWYPNEIFTLGAFGGGLFGLQNQGNPFDDGEGWYIGGHATFYAQPNFAIGVDGRYLELSESFGPDSYEYGSLRVGGKARYLTSLSGVELFAAANYVRCDEEASFGQGPGRSIVADGFEVLVGMNIRLGGNTNSLLEIDRSNAVDTRVWHCEFGGVPG
jgi:hypothetical protein